jgi:chemotaxis protein MotB
LAGKKGKGRDGANVTIVIRRDEGEEAGHHGGAWKVAYADFVTAMMAFFLLMWLLNATTEEQRTGLADYFAPTNLFGRSASGSGQPFGGQTPHDAGTSVSTSGSPQVTQGRQSPQPDVESEETDTPATPLVRKKDAEDDGTDPHQGTGDGTTASASTVPGQGKQALVQGGDYAAARLTPAQGKETAGGGNAAEMARRNAASQTAAEQTPTQQAAAQQEAVRKGDADRETNALERAGAQVMEAVRNDPSLGDAKGQLLIDTVPEGLRIQVIDAERRPMFALGGTAPTSRVRELLQKVVPALADLPNALTIAGHTDSTTFRGQDKSNWELSTERALTARRVLLEAGLAEDRIRSVTGNADRDLLVSADPFNASNRRITIVVLRNAGARAATQAAGQNGPAKP